jgi:hypothetical protein
VDQISPELALVDPELAAEARAALPEPRPFVRPRPVERPTAVEPPGPVGRTGAIEQPGAIEGPAAARRPPRRSRRKRVAGLLALAGALVVAASLAAVMLDQRRAEPEPTLRSAQAPPPPAVRPPAAAQKLPADRVFSWAPAKGALYYRVEFFRNGKLFHAAQTADPALRLPGTLRFPPGAYRWSVRPATVGNDGVAMRAAILTRSFRVGRG